MNMNVLNRSSRTEGLVDKTKNLFSRLTGRNGRSRRRRGDRVRRALTRAGTGLATTAALVAGYRYAFQPWHQTWGATTAEAEKPLPGDGLVPNPSYETTRAVTIEAPTEAVWPWLVQMGQGRGGFYSYDWLENLFGLDIHNTDHIVSEWQDLEPGDEVWLAPPTDYDGQAKMRVIHLEPRRSLVFGPAVDTAQDFEAASQTGAGTWAFVLEPIDDQTTRLIVRTRSRPWQAPRGVFYLYDPAHFLMERRMMLGIKGRAESSAQVRGEPPTEEREHAHEPAETDL